MEGESRNLKKSLRMAILWVLLLLAALTGSTYAWFTFSGSASTNVTPAGGTISSGDAVLLIGNAEAGPFDKTCDLITSGNPDGLEPVSTADLENFYQGTYQNADGITILYERAEDALTSQVVYGTLYLKCENASCDVYFNQEELNLGSNGQTLAAMRLGMIISTRAGEERRIFKLDGLGQPAGAQAVQTVPENGTVVASVSENGQASYTADPAVEIQNFFAGRGASEGTFTAGADKLCTLEKDEVAQVRFWLYLEGCDEHCSNAVQNLDGALQLGFAGADADGERSSAQ